MNHPDCVLAVHRDPDRRGEFKIGRFKRRPTGLYSLFDYVARGPYLFAGEEGDHLMAKAYSSPEEAVIDGAAEGIQIAIVDSDYFFNYVGPGNLMSGYIRWEDFEWN